MLDNYHLKIPAKINLFLNVLSERNDGFHNIKSGITFLNLFNEISVNNNHNTTINYSGKFKPINNHYDNCIIKKTLNIFQLTNKVNLHIHIKKNIPTQAGLGSASADAAGLIKILIRMKLIEPKENKFYSLIGSDVPVFLFNKNAIVSGVGDEVEEAIFPKYFFLLVKPNISFSTKTMYEKIIIKSKNFKENNFQDINDFEKIAIKESQEIKRILEYLSNTQNSILSRMTGSGSCCFSTYKKLEYAEKAQKQFNVNFPDLWTFVGYNNI